MAQISGTSGNDRGVTALHGTTGDDVIDGLGGNDDLYSDDGNDVLNGGTGADHMYGGNGDDRYKVDNTNDKVFESSNAGFDSIYSSVTYAIADNVERLVLTGDANLVAKGSARSDILVSNDGNSRLDGNDGNDFLYGGRGNDTLDGGKGDDHLRGGDGNDRYYVDLNDIVTEDRHGGIDIVYSASTYTLGDNVEILTLTGSADHYGTGNDMDNLITGNSGNNTLGGAGGDDIIDGGKGADTMRGGTGNDTFLVDNSGDTVGEYQNAGFDTVISSVAFTLGNNVEALILTGSDDLNGTGNSLHNVLTGNDGDNVLNGKGGADVMAGGKGNDTYYVDNRNDVVIELNHGGTDTVYASVDFNASGWADSWIENIHLIGTGDTSVHGNSHDNVLSGNSGDNFIAGMGGTDTLIGGLGADVFAFGDHDGTATITDFSTSQDDMIAYDGDHMHHPVITQVGADVHISFGDHETIIVLNTIDNAAFRDHIVSHD